MTTQAAKFPAAIAANADLYADASAAGPLTLNGLHSNVVATITTNESVPASWPAVGDVLVDSEIVHYTGKGPTSLTGCTRGTQTTFGAGAAASHNGGANVYLVLTPQMYAQSAAEIIAIETQLTSGILNPNLVLNSDFGRRTVFGLAMPEVFADTSGATAVDGALGTVAGNVLTAGTNGTWSAKWCGTNAAFYRDARFSALVKQLGTGTTNAGRIGIGKTDGTAWLTGNGVYATFYRTALNTVTLELIKVVAGVVTVVASQAGVTWNDGRVGWAEVEAQGMTYIARFYDQGSGTPGVKSAATRLDTTVISGTISDAGVVSGQPMAVNGSGVGAATVWGGIATGNGGVYVETWLPESWSVDFGGTLGGQAIGYDESTDAGPLGLQYAMRAYIPATSRTMTARQNVDSSPTRRTSGKIAPSTSYTFSAYVKTSGSSGAATLNLVAETFDQALGNVTTFGSALNDNQEASWTRKSVTATTASTARFFDMVWQVNPSSNKTGTFWFSAGQLEQGSAATAWRNAPADDGPIVWKLQNRTGAPANDVTTTSTSLVEVESRDYAADIFLPWDADVRVEFNPTFRQTYVAGSGYTVFDLQADGASLGDSGGTGYISTPTGLSGLSRPVYQNGTALLAAGKHRIRAMWNVDNANNTATIGGAGVASQGRLIITATRGK